jgi:mitochondrial fission protein ELM1
VKKRSKLIYILVSIIFAVTCGYNFYQRSIINNYKKELTHTVRWHLQRFAGLSNNIDNDTIYAEKYASIVAAQDAYFTVADNNAIPSEEWSSSLPGLLLALKQVMLNDKEKFKVAFEQTDASRLMFKIADNFEDKDSIYKVYKLLSDSDNDNK